jgi:hypothetical protein
LKGKENMNPTELAHAMLEWETTQRKADELAETIKAAVLEVGKTQTVGNVRASYSAGRKSYNYREAWDIEFDELPEEQFMVVSYDYNAACKDAGIEVPFTQSDPSVSIKLLKG